MLTREELNEIVEDNEKHGSHVAQARLSLIMANKGEAAQDLVARAEQAVVDFIQALHQNLSADVEKEIGMAVNRWTELLQEQIARISTSSPPATIAE